MSPLVSQRVSGGGRDAVDFIALTSQRPSSVWLAIVVFRAVRMGVLGCVFAQEDAAALQSTAVAVSTLLSLSLSVRRLVGANTSSGIFLQLRRQLLLLPLSLYWRRQSQSRNSPGLPAQSISYGHGPPPTHAKVLVGWATVHSAPSIIGPYVWYL